MVIKNNSVLLNICDITSFHVVPISKVGYCLSALTLEKTIRRGITHLSAKERDKIPCACVTSGFWYKETIQAM
jgi:hypothetical protein